MTRKINFLPDTNHECLKVVKNEAYFFSDESELAVYEFESNRDAELWKNKRALLNFKEKELEDFQCCNNDGEFSWDRYYILCKSIGKLPAPPLTLAQILARDEFLGEVTSDDDAIREIEINRFYHEPKKIKRDSQNKSISRKEKLKQLTDASNLPEWMGELLLTEIKATTDTANAHLRQRVKLLGLD